MQACPAVRVPVTSPSHAATSLVLSVRPHLAPFLSSAMHAPATSASYLTPAVSVSFSDALTWAVIEARQLVESNTSLAEEQHSPRLSQTRLAMAAGSSSCEMGAASSSPDLQP